MSNRTEYSTVMHTNVEAHPEGIELTTEGITLILQGSPAELANLASDLLASIATLARQQHDVHPADCRYCAAGEGMRHTYEPPAEEGSAEDASRECRQCGDDVATLSSRDWCDACEEEDATCRNERCDNSTADGEGWDGLCGSCADRMDEDDD